MVGPRREPDPADQQVPEDLPGPHSPSFARIAGVLELGVSVLCYVRTTTLDACVRVDVQDPRMMRLERRVLNLLSKVGVRT